MSDSPITLITCTDIDGYGCCRTCGNRVECGRCRNPYDEDKDALGVCAECLAEAFVPCTHDWVRCASCRQRVLTGSEVQHRCPARQYGSSGGDDV